jgi:Protein of unknown function (DUF3822)
VKQLFFINNEIADNVQPGLLLRMGDDHACFAIINKATNALQQLAYYAVEEWSSDEINNFLSAIPDSGSAFYNMQVAWDFCRSSFLPATNQQNAALLLSGMYGAATTGEITITEALQEWQLQNIYAVPQLLHDSVLQRFPAAKFCNQFTLQVKKLNAGKETGTIWVNFRQKTFTATILKQSRFLLAQTFEYTTPEDVLFYLLKACHQFSLQQQEVQVQLSGLIDKNSALYKELYQYFIQLNFREASWKTHDEYPPHFFTSLNDLVQCV